MCVSKVKIIGLDNGFSPGRRQAIIWTNARILLIGPFGQTSMKFKTKCTYFHSRKCIWMCRQQIGVHFVSSSMCLWFLVLCNSLSFQHYVNLSNLSTCRRVFLLENYFMDILNWQCFNRSIGSWIFVDVLYWLCLVLPMLLFVDVSVCLRFVLSTFCVVVPVVGYHAIYIV